MNKQVVTVIGNKSGEVLSVSPNNPEYGWLVVESTQPTFQEGFLRLGKRVAFIAGSVTQLGQYIANLKLEVGSELPGKIVIKEQLDPIDPENVGTGIKYPNAAAKDAGLACTLNDAPIYRKAYYTPNLSTITEEYKNAAIASAQTQQEKDKANALIVGIFDVEIKHDNGADIKEFMAGQQAAAAKPQSAGIKGAAAKVTNKVK